MNELIALAAFGLVASGTPGPNNILLWATGLKYGYRSTLPHIAGVSIGLGTMALAVAAGIGALVTTVPEVELVLKVIGSGYLIFLAYQVAGIGKVEAAEVARPLSLAQSIAFQYVNPKAWFFALAAITTFRPPEYPVWVGSLLVAGVMMVVVLPTASLWAAGGTVLSRLLAGRGTGRWVNIGLALLLAATVVMIWV